MQVCESTGFLCTTMCSFHDVLDFENFPMYDLNIMFYDHSVCEERRLLFSAQRIAFIFHV